MVGNTPEVIMLLSLELAKPLRRLEYMTVLTHGLVRSSLNIFLSRSRVAQVANFAFRDARGLKINQTDWKIQKKQLPGGASSGAAAGRGRQAAVNVGLRSIMVLIQKCTFDTFSK